MAGIAFEQPNMMVGVFPANIDMSAEPVPGIPTYQFTVVDLYAPASGVTTEAGAGLNLASSGFPALGILQNNPQKNEAGSVMVQGISKAKIGSGGCTVGQLLMSDGLGNLVVATSGNHAIAKACNTASSGDIAAVVLKSYGKV